MAELAALPVLARLEEVEAIASLSTEKITDEIEAVVGSTSMAALEIGLFSCEEIDLGVGVTAKAIETVLIVLCRTLGTVIDAVDLTIGAMLSKAGEFLSEAIGAVTSVAIRIEDSVASTISGIVSGVTGQVDSLLRGITGGLENVIRDVGGFLGDLIERIERSVRDVLDAVGFGINALIDTVGVAFGSFVSSVERLVTRLDDTVRNVGEFLVELASTTLDSMALSIASVLGPLIGAGESVLARLGDLVESIPGALKDAAGFVAETINEFGLKPLGTMGSILVEQIEEFFSRMVSAGELSYGAVLRPFFRCFDIPEISIDKIVCAADDSAPQTPAFFVAALAFMVPLLVAQAAGSALAPVGEQISQEVSRAVRQSLIPPTDLLDGFTKGDISETRLRDDFAQAGFSDERTDELLSSFRSAPDPSIQIQAWLRGLIEEGELDTALAQNRMRPADVTLLKEVVFFVPPAQDLIRMAVREVFSPEIRARFGQDEDFPEEFATFAAQQGISDEWARAYWAAHWALPSPAQGFEMLHRKVIEATDLDSLLRALDVMPFWRDKLTQIAFSPLTRVDLRRMHALGLLTDAQLQTRYEAIGFSADDAELMVAFTVVFNSSEDELPEELVGLTRASILNMFEDGLIPRDDAVSLIDQMGIGTDAAELFVEQRDMEVGRRERNDLIESIIRLAGGGRINLSQAEDSLAQLGISAIEITRAVGRITGLIDDRDRLPSLAALQKMHKKEIIDDETFLESIKALGFNDEWADREFELLTGSVEA